MLRVLACSERLVEKVMGPPQRGFVHSAFASAANLGFSNGFLLSLNTSPALQNTPVNKSKHTPLLPNGLLLSAHAGEWPFTVLRAGMPVVVGAGWLTIEALSCSLDCSVCPHWHPHVEHPELLDIALIGENARQVSALCQSARPQQADALCAHMDNETLPEVAAKLCGRGPGLTPSGDDFLAGWMAVGWLLYGPQPSFLASCLRVNEIASQRTHRLSQCWLAYAAAGDVAHPIRELLSTMTRRDPASLANATQNVLSLGATSGYDLLQGILHGIEQFPHF